MKDDWFESLLDCIEWILTQGARLDPLIDEVKERFKDWSETVIWFIFGGRPRR